MAGTYTVSARYLGDALFSASGAAVQVATVTVGQTFTLTINGLKTSPLSYTPGELANVSVTVPTGAAGTVQFSRSGLATVVSVAHVGQTFTASFNAPNSGTFTVTATYVPNPAGDAYGAASVTSPAAQVLIPLYLSKAVLTNVGAGGVTYTTADNLGTGVGTFQASSKGGFDAYAFVGAGSNTLNLALPANATATFASSGTSTACNIAATRAATLGTVPKAVGGTAPTGINVVGAGALKPGATLAAGSVTCTMTITVTTTSAGYVPTNTFTRTYTVIP